MKGKTITVFNTTTVEPIYWWRERPRERINMLFFFGQGYPGINPSFNLFIFLQKTVLKSNRTYVLGSFPLQLAEWKSGVIEKAETGG